MSLDRKYIYGIVGESERRSFTFSGVADSEVYTINHEGLAAVVSDSEFEEVDPTRKNIRAHTMVQEELLRRYTLLPMGFGMIADSRDDVLRLLKMNCQALADELTRLAGKVEVELKVFWDKQAMVRELEGGSEEYSRLKANIETAQSPIERQRLLVEAGQLVERVALDWKAKYADRVYTALKRLSIDAKQNNLFGATNVLNASFLVEKARESDFQQQVYTLDTHYRGKVNFKYVGPLPPYSFVTARLEEAS